MTYMRTKQVVFLGLFLVCALAPPFSIAQGLSVFQGRETGAYLGISMEDVSKDNMTQYKLASEKGVIVSAVKKGSPAEEATIKEDDVIIEFGGFPIWSASHLSRLVQETPVGRKTDIVVLRDGKRLTLSAVLGRLNQQFDEDPRGWLDKTPNPSKPYKFQWEAPAVPDNRNTVIPEGKLRLGITMQPLTDQLAEFLGVPEKKGALIASVAEGSPSAGKLRSGDVIVAVDNKEIDRPEDLARLIRTAPSGQITIKIVRDKKAATVVIDLPLSEERTKGYKL